MSERNQIQSRLYLETARFFYQQMEANFQDRTKFTYSFLAFLPIARSVTLVFKKEFHSSEKLMAWYGSKVEEWKNNKIMKFFIKMRNVSVKEHAPETRVTVEKTWGIDFIIGNPPPVQIRRTKDGKEIWFGKLPLKSSKVVKYSFGELPKWFDKNPDVMYLCEKYLGELERFVSEAENMIKKKE